MEISVVRNFIIGLIILAFAAFWVLWFFGPEGYEVLEAATIKSAPAITFTVTNLVVPGNEYGPVTIAPRLNDGTWTYQITATPELKFTGTRTTPVEVISLIEFKGQTVKAKIDFQNDLRDTFTINPGATQNSYALTAEISTEIPPVKDVGNAFTGTLKENEMILMKDGEGKIIFHAEDISRHYSDLTRLEVPGCKAQFVVECANNGGGFTLEECTPDDQYICKGVGIICGGTIELEMADISCLDGTADVTARYSGGNEWPNAGEKVIVSFWEANECTRRRSSVIDMSGCREINPETGRERDFRMGRFVLTHPLLE